MVTDKTGQGIRSQPELMSPLFKPMNIIALDCSVEETTLTNQPRTHHKFLYTWPTLRLIKVDFFKVSLDSIYRSKTGITCHAPSVIQSGCAGTHFSHASDISTVLVVAVA
jgi:hypothetical protein